MVSKEVLLEKYEGERKSIRAVAKEINKSSSTVLKLLKQYNIPVRNKSQSRLLHFEVNETVNSDFFKTMSPDLAYILGLWITDGCAYERGSYSIGLKDKEVIEWVASKIGYKNKIWEITEKLNGSKRYFIQFTNQIAKQTFDQYGVVPNKSLITKMPTLPKEFIPHFVRGVFEGDGSIGKYKYSYAFSIVSASEEFIVGIKNIIESEIGGDRTIKFDKRGNGLYSYNIYGKDTLNRLGEWLYPAGVFGMERKQRKFAELANEIG